MTYILTETHPNRGHKGLLVDQDAYVAVPWFDRAIFEVVNQDSEQFYLCRLNVKCGEKYTDYLLVDDRHIAKLLSEFGLDQYVGAVQAEVGKGSNITITSPHNDCVYFFTPIVH